MPQIKPTVDIIIPAFNEESIISKTVLGCKNIYQYNSRIIVIVDGKTTDNTAKEAKKSGAIVIRSSEKRGKGALFRSALKHVKSKYVVQIDADHQFQPNEIPKLVDQLIKSCDVALGTRYEKGSMVEMYSVSFLKLFGSHFLSRVTSFFSGNEITDVMAGFKGFRAEVLKDINLKTDHFGYEAEVVIKAAKKGFTIKNVPITYTARPAGSSSVNSIKHGLLVLETILKTGFSK